MANLLYSVAQELQNPLLTGIAQSIITVDHTLQFMDTLSIGDAIVHKFNRENDLGNSGSFVAPGTTITASQFTTVPVSDQIKECIASVVIPNVFNNTTQLAAQLAAKTKVIRRAYGNSFINGAGSDDLSGLAVLVPTGSSMTIYGTAGTGSALTIAQMDQLYDKVAALAQPTFFVANRQTINQYRQLVRANAGGMFGYEIQTPTLNGPNQTYVALHGVPIIPSDWISLTETWGITNGSTTSVYAVYSSAVDGLHLFYSTNTGAQLFNVAGPKPMPGANAVTYDITMNVGLSLKSTFSVARLAGVNS